MPTAVKFRTGLVLLSLPLLFAQAPQRVIKIEDMHAFHDVRDPQISPDGKWVAYTVSSVDVAADKSDTDVWMASWDGAKQMRMTSSPDAENAPRWSPDGRYLSFLSSRNGGKARGAQVWLLDRTGGEAQQFTDVKGRSDFLRLVARFEEAAAHHGGSRTRRARRPSGPGAAGGGRGGAAGPNAPAPKPIVIDRYKFKQDVIGYLTQKPGRLYLYDIATKKADALTPETLESRAARVVARRQLGCIPGQGGQGRRALQHLERICGGSPRRRLAAHPDHVRRRSAPPPAAAVPTGVPTASASPITQSSGAKQNAYNMNRLAVVPVAGGEPKIFAEKLDRSVSAPRFTKDGKSILFLVTDDRWEYPAIVPANGGEVERLFKGPGVIATLEESKDGKIAVLAGGDNTHPEIHVVENGKLRAITHHNDELMARS